MLFRFGQIGRVKKNRQHIERDRPNDQDQKFIEAPIDFVVPLKRYPPLQNKNEQRGDRENNVDFVHRILFATIKSASSTRQQIGYAETDDDRHQSRDELEAAHLVLQILHSETILSRLSVRCLRQQPV